MSAMEIKKAIVIGGGISGLCAAFELKRGGADVTLLEKSDRVGGVIGTHCEDGFKAESGTNTVMVNNQNIFDLFDSIGLSDEIARALPSAKKRFFVKCGKPMAVPMSPFSFLFSRLFSLGGKVRILREPFVKKEDPESEPSVAEFAVHRFGQEGLDYGLDPFMAGVYGGDPEKLSIKYAFPPFWNLVQKYGSVIGGGIKSMKEKSALGNYFKPVLISFKNGMKTLTDKLGEILGDSVKISAKVISVDASKGGWQVSWGTPEGDFCEEFDALVLAVPAHALAELPLCGNLASALKPLSEIRYAPVATLTLGFKKSDIPHPLDGFGALIPKKENLSILGSLFVSSIFDGRAPSDHITLTNYVGGERNPELAGLPEGKITEIVLADLRKILGLKGVPVFRKLYSWKHAIAQYNLGYGKILDTADLAEKEIPNFAIIGSFRGGVGVGNCIENGLTAGKRILDKLSKE